MRNLLLSCLAAIGAVMAPGAAAQTIADIPAEIRPHIPQNLRPYFVVFLLTPAQPKQMPHELFLAHQAYIRRQIEAGVFHVVGPMLDAGRIRGMKIISAASIEDARRIAGDDPAVQQGIFEIEVHPAMFPDLSPVKAEYLPKP